MSNFGGSVKKPNQYNPKMGGGLLKSSVNAYYFRNIWVLQQPLFNLTTLHDQHCSSVCIKENLLSIEAGLIEKEKCRIIENLYSPL